MRRAPETPTERALLGVGRMNPGAGGGRSALVTPPARTPGLNRKGVGREVFVAADDAMDQEKELAWRVCDGTSDQDELNEAHEYVWNRDGWAAVRLSSGHFATDDKVHVPRANAMSGEGAATRIESTATDALEVVAVADFFDFGVVNADPVGNPNFVGIRSIEDPDTPGVIWVTGRLDNVEIYDFDTMLRLEVSEWLVTRCLFWGAGLAATPWGVKNVGGFGQSIFAFNRWVAAHGIYDEIGKLEVIENIFGGSPRVAFQDTAAAGHSVLTRNRQVGPVEVAGDQNEISFNQAVALTTDVTADATHYFGNRSSSITADNGTNTKINLDGSANDWNW